MARPWDPKSHENYEAIDNVALKDVAQPEITPGMVRVRIQAASVGFVDGLKVRGLYQTKDPLPFTPGTEFAGTVDALAPDVEGFAPGTPVIGMARSGGLLSIFASQLQRFSSGRKAWHRKLARRFSRIILQRSIR